MTTLENRPNTALLVIDVQNGVVDGAHDRDTVVANIGTVVEKARAAAVPVIWVQHASDNLPEGSQQWEIVSELSPDEREPLIPKRYPDSFEEYDARGGPGRSCRRATRRRRRADRRMRTFDVARGARSRL